MGLLNIRESDIMVVVDLYVAGKDEFGGDYTAECYSVIAQNQDGKRMAFNTTWFGCEAGETEACPEDGYGGGDRYFADVRKEAKAKADELKLRVEDKGVINCKFWTEIDPAYGSAHYCKVHGF